MLEVSPEGFARADYADGIPETVEEAECHIERDERFLRCGEMVDRFSYLIGLMNYLRLETSKCVAENVLADRAQTDERFSQEYVVFALNSQDGVKLVLAHKSFLDGKASDAFVDSCLESDKIVELFLVEDTLAERDGSHERVVLLLQSYRVIQLVLSYQAISDKKLPQKGVWLFVHQVPLHSIYSRGSIPDAKLITLRQQYRCYISEKPDAIQVGPQPVRIVVISFIIVGGQSLAMLHCVFSGAERQAFGGGTDEPTYIRPDCTVEPRAHRRRSLIERDTFRGE